MMAANHTCQYEDQLHSHSRKISELETKADYKEKRIDELNDKINEIDKKLDKVLEKFNDLKIQSNKDDNQLELRLTTIETELEANRRAMMDYRNRFTTLLTVITVFFTALTFIFNYILK